MTVIRLFLYNLIILTGLAANALPQECGETLVPASSMPLEPEKVLQSLPEVSSPAGNVYDLKELVVRFQHPGGLDAAEATEEEAEFTDVPQFVNLLTPEITPIEFSIAKKLIEEGRDPIRIRSGIRRAVDDPERLKHYFANFPDRAGQSPEEIFAAGVEIGVIHLEHASEQISTIPLPDSLMPSSIEIDATYLKAQIEEIRSQFPEDPPVRLNLYHFHPIAAPLSPSDNVLAMMAAREFQLITTIIAFTEYEGRIYGFYSHERYWRGMQIGYDDTL